MSRCVSSSIFNRGMTGGFSLEKNDNRISIDKSVISLNRNLALRL